MLFHSQRLQRLFLGLTAAIFTFGLTAAMANDSPQIAAQQNLILSNAAQKAQPDSPPSLVPPAPSIDAKGYVLMDANTGMIIASKNMDERMEPASLTKLMTLYLTFQALQSGQIRLDDKARVSVKAWRMGGSRMFLKEGSEVPVTDLIKGIIVASGNDACVTMAQFIAGTENTFAQMMNQTAERLGMKSTHYVDSTGLPNANHYTTPHDMAILTRALITDFPQYYHFFNEKWLTYNHIRQPNRNRLLWRDHSVDGLKTGHTEAAGYCLIASADRDGMRLISVVMGTPSDSARASDSEALLNYGFRFYKTHKLFGKDTRITQQRVWLGQSKKIDFGVENPLYVTIPVGEFKNLKASMKLQKHLRAPIVQGKAYGEIDVMLNGKQIFRAPLVALQNDERGGVWTSIRDHTAIFFRKIIGK